MDKDRGFVIAFHNNETQFPYLGLHCRDRAIRSLKRHISAEIVRNLMDRGRKDQKEVLKRMGLETGILNRDGEVLEFIQRKIAQGDSIFLDFKEQDAIAHNISKSAQLFLIVSILVTPSTFTFLNADRFSRRERDLIVSIVDRSQDGSLKYKGAVWESVL